MRSVWSQSSGICSYFWQVTDISEKIVEFCAARVEANFSYIPYQEEGPMIEGGIMNDELDL